MSARSVPIESVSGGSHGVEAGYAQMTALAFAYDAAAVSFLGMAGLGAKTMANGDLLESAVLSPATFANAELQVLDATTGADGLTVRAVGIEADAIATRACVEAFVAADELSYRVSEAVDYALGRVIGTAAVAFLPELLVIGGVGYLVYRTMSPEQQQEIRDQLGQLIHDHPEVAQHLINGGGGLMQSLAFGADISWLNPGDGPVGQATTNDAARLLAHVFGNDTEYAVHARSDIGSGAADRQTPASLEDLMKQLDRTNALDAGPGEHRNNGAIQIQKIMENGAERYIVYLPGTDDMNPFPTVDKIVRDMLTNYQLIGGMDSAYGKGIVEAMRDAGLAGKDVMLVGHSQGGMAATGLAADPRFQDEFKVKHVMTAGSPTAQVPEIPHQTTALHLENRGDAIPLLDGEPNPDQPNRVTVQFDDGSCDIAGNHGIDRYANGAAAADSSTDGSIRDLVSGMETSGFLGSGTVTEVMTYQVTR